MQSWNPWEGAAASYAAQQQALGFPNVTTAIAPAAYQTAGANPGGYAAYSTQPPPAAMPQQWGAANVQDQWQQQQQWQQWQQQFQQWHVQYGDKYQEAMKASGMPAEIPALASMAGMAGVGGSWVDPTPPPPLPKDQPPPPPEEKEKPPPPPLDWPQDQPYRNSNTNTRGGRGNNQNRGGNNRGVGNNNRGGGANSRGGGNIQNRNDNFQSNQFNSFQQNAQGFQKGKRSQDGDSSYSGDGKRSRQDDFVSDSSFGRQSDNRGNKQGGDRGRGGRGSRGARGGRGRGNKSFQQPDYNDQGYQAEQNYGDYPQEQNFGEEPFPNEGYEPFQSAQDKYLSTFQKGPAGKEGFRNEPYQAKGGKRGQFHQGPGGKEGFRDKQFQGQESFREQTSQKGKESFKKQPPPLMGSNFNFPDKAGTPNPSLLSAATAGSSVITEESKDEPSEAEKAFDAQFQVWEQQFNTWKDQNKNHPDTSQYREYEAKWESWREQLLSRREGMRKKREGNAPSPSPTNVAPPAAAGKAGGSGRFQPDNQARFESGKEGNRFQQDKGTRFQPDKGPDNQNRFQQDKGKGPDSQNRFQQDKGPRFQPDKGPESRFQQDKGKGPDGQNRFQQDKGPRFQPDKGPDGQNRFQQDKGPRFQPDKGPDGQNRFQQDKGPRFQPDKGPDGQNQFQQDKGPRFQPDKGPDGQNRFQQDKGPRFQPDKGPDGQNRFQQDKGPRFQPDKGPDGQNRFQQGGPDNQNRFQQGGPDKGSRFPPHENQNRFQQGGPDNWFQGKGPEAQQGNRFQGRPGEDRFPQQGNVPSRGVPPGWQHQDRDQNFAGGASDFDGRGSRPGFNEPGKSGGPVESASKLTVRSFGEKWDKPEGPKIKSIEETLKSLFPLKTNNAKSAKDPMLITLGEEEAALGLGSKSSGGGIPGLDLLSADATSTKDEKLPDNAAPLVKEPPKPLMTPDTDKPFVDPKSAADTTPQKKVPWQSDDYFDETLAGEEQQPAHDYREQPPVDEWPQEEVPGWQASTDQDERHGPPGFNDAEFRDQEMPPRGREFSGDRLGEFPLGPAQFEGRDFGPLDPHMEPFNEFGPRGNMDSRDFGPQRPGLEAPFGGRGQPPAGRGRGLGERGRDFGRPGMDREFGLDDFRGRPEIPGGRMFPPGREFDPEYREGDHFPDNRDVMRHPADREGFYRDDYPLDYPRDYIAGDYPPEDDYYRDRNYPSFAQRREEDFPPGHNFPPGRDFPPGRGRGFGREGFRDEEFPPCRDFPPGERDFGAKGRDFAGPVGGRGLDREFGGPGGRDLGPGLDREFGPGGRGLDRSFDREFAGPGGRGLDRGLDREFGPGGRGLDRGLDREFGPGGRGLDREFGGPGGRGLVDRGLDREFGGPGGRDLGPGLDREFGPGGRGLDRGLDREFAGPGVRGLDRGLDREFGGPAAGRSLSREPAIPPGTSRPQDWAIPAKDSKEPNRLAEKESTDDPARLPPVVAGPERPPGAPARMLPPQQPSRPADRGPYMPPRPGPRPGDWGWEDGRFSERRGFQDSMKPPPMMLWEEEFKPATVVDYGHQAAVSVVSAAVPPIVVPKLPKKEEFQEPLQTFDYGHGKAATAAAAAAASAKSADKESEWSQGRRESDRGRPERWEEGDRRGGWDRDDRRRPWNEDRGRGKRWEEDEERRDRGDRGGRDRDKRPKEEPKRTFSPPPAAPPPPSMEPAPECVQVEDLLCLPGRVARPPRIAIFMRGPPGCGKSFVAKLIKDKELENGGHAPRILCLDDYFMTETEKECADPETGRRFIKKIMAYEYEPEMEKHYRSSLSRGFKKTVDDGYFPFIILDCVNDKLNHFEELWNYAKQKGFQNYVAEMEVEAVTCAKRNEHGRTLRDVEDILKGWEPTPNLYPRVDLCALLQSASINEVEMEDLSDDELPPLDEEAGVDPVNDENSQEEGVVQLPTSKWEQMERSEEKLDRLDGLMKKRHQEPKTMEDWLQLPDDYESRPAEPGKKRVRWADLEERKEQERMRAVGFVVGQTDWSRMTDPTFGEGKLTQTKYI